MGLRWLGYPEAGIGSFRTCFRIYFTSTAGTSMEESCMVCIMCRCAA